MKTYDHTDALRSPMLETFVTSPLVSNCNLGDAPVIWPLVEANTTRADLDAVRLRAHNPYSTDYPCGETHY